MAQVTEVGVACDVDAKNFVAHVASFGASTDVAHALDKDNNKLTITLASAVAPGAQAVIRTVTNAVPTEHVLEGASCGRCGRSHDMALTRCTGRLLAPLCPRRRVPGPPAW